MYNLIADSFALVLFVSILGIVGLSLYSLSPRSYESTLEKTNQQVLGIEDSIESKNVVYTNLDFSEFRGLNEDVLDSKVYKSDDGFIYLIKNLSKLNSNDSIELFEIYNNANQLTDYKMTLIIRPQEPFALEKINILFDGEIVEVSTNQEAEYQSQFSIEEYKKTRIGLVIDTSMKLVDGCEIEFRIEQTKNR